MTQDVRCLHTDGNHLNRMVVRLDRHVEGMDWRFHNLENAQAFVFRRHRDSHHPSTSAHPPSIPQEWYFWVLDAKRGRRTFYLVLDGTSSSEVSPPIILG